MFFFQTFKTNLHKNIARYDNLDKMCFAIQSTVWWPCYLHIIVYTRTYNVFPTCEYLQSTIDQRWLNSNSHPLNTQTKTKGVENIIQSHTLTYCWSLSNFTMKNCPGGELESDVKTKRGQNWIWFADELFQVCAEQTENTIKSKTKQGTLYREREREGVRRGKVKNDPFHYKRKCGQIYDPFATDFNFNVLIKQHRVRLPSDERESKTISVKVTPETSGTEEGSTGGGFSGSS